MSRGISLGFNQSPLNLQASRVLLAAPLVPITMTAPIANVKFAPGDWAQSQNINGSPSPAGNGRNAAEIALFKQHPCVGYKAWYTWRGLEKAQGDPSLFQSMWVADLNQHQAINPGSLFQVMIDTGANVPGNSLTPAQADATIFKTAIPDYVLNCGGTLVVPNSYGSSQTTTYLLGRQQNGQYGFSLSGWNIVAPGTYNEIFANFFDPAVTRAFCNFLQMFFTTPFKVTAGPYAGQTFTYDTCPLTPKFVWNDEYSLNVNVGGFNPPASTNPSNQPTAANYFKGWLQVCNTISQAAPHTLFDQQYSWGFVGTTGDSNTSFVARLPQLAAIPRLCASAPDTFAEGFTATNPQATFGQQGYIGITAPTAGNGSTLQPADPTKAYYGTPMLNTAQAQSPDFGSKFIPGHTTADSVQVIQDIIASAAVMHSFERSWSMGGFQLNQAVMWPIIQATFKAAAPPNWLIDPVLSTVAAGHSNITLNWMPRPYVTGYVVKRATNPGMSGAVTFNPTATTFNDTGLSASTNYWYTIQAAYGTQTSPGNHTYQEATTA